MTHAELGVDLKGHTEGPKGPDELSSGAPFILLHKWRTGVRMPSLGYPFIVDRTSCWTPSLEQIVEMIDSFGTAREKLALELVSGLSGKAVWSCG